MVVGVRYDALTWSGLEALTLPNDRNPYVLRSACHYDPRPTLRSSRAATTVANGCDPPMLGGRRYSVKPASCAAASRCSGAIVSANPPRRRRAARRGRNRRPHSVVGGRVFFHHPRSGAGGEPMLGRHRLREHTGG